MRRISVMLAFTVAVALSFRAEGDSTSQSTVADLATDFVGVTNARDYWLREFDLTLREGGRDPAGVPKMLKSCIVEETLAASSNYLSDRVLQFIEDKSNANYAMIVVAAQSMMVNGREVDADIFSKFSHEVCLRRTANSQ